jgi:hypothetical protein
MNMSEVSSKDNEEKIQTFHAYIAMVFILCQK